jgi:glycosyltransferase involved in cell wall biosynthesis
VKTYLNEVTCVVPTFNRVALLDRALNSIFKQSQLPIETIVASNGVSAEVQLCVKKYQNSGLNIKLIETEEVVDAWNNWFNGINSVNTKYLKIVWDDDWLEPNCLEEMSSWMKRYDASAVITGAFGHINGQKYTWYQIPEFECNNPNLMAIYSSKRMIPNSPLAALLETKDVLSAMLYKNYPVGAITPNLVVGPDFAMNIWAVLDKRKLYFNPAPLVNMYSDGKNMTDAYSKYLPSLYKKTLWNLFREIEPKISLRSKIMILMMPSDSNQHKKDALKMYIKRFFKS